MLLLRICEIIYAPAVTDGMLCYLQQLIADHHKLLRRLFPNKRLINKHHHLIHYPDSIKKCGPMIHQWCMRYEGKHNFFKVVSGVVCNFKNIVKTMALRHQIQLCESWSSKKRKCKRIVSFVPGCQKTIQESGMIEQFERVGLRNGDEVYFTKKVQLSGTEYRVGSFVCTKGSATSDNGMPSFARLVDIVIYENAEVYFIVQPASTLFLDSTVNAFVISSPVDVQLEVIGHNKLADHLPLDIWSTYNDAKKYISLRYHIL